MCPCLLGMSKAKLAPGENRFPHEKCFLVEALFLVQIRVLYMKLCGGQLRASRLTRERKYCNQGIGKYIYSTLSSVMGYMNSIISNHGFFFFHSNNPHGQRKKKLHGLLICTLYIDFLLSPRLEYTGNNIFTHSHHVYSHAHNKQMPLDNLDL